MTEPERIARTFLMANIELVLGYEDVEAEVGGMTSGSTIFRKALRVFSGTPASVKSLMAPLSKPHPCWKMRIEMRVPKEGTRRMLEIGKLHTAQTLTPKSIQWKAWNCPAANNSNESNCA